MLKRDISTINILVAAAGGMVGSGWLFSPFISAQIAGSAALISWIIAAIFMLFIALPLCELGAMLPLSGGMANYPTLTHGKEVGFLFAWITWLSYVVMTPIETQAIIQYGSHFFPILVTGAGAIKLSGYGYVAAVLIMFAVVALNTFGIKLLAECNKYASIFKFLIPSFAIFMFLHAGRHSFNNINFSLHEKETWKQIFSALSMGGIAFAFTGFQNGLMLAGEVKNPQRNIPIAILGAVIVGFILYFMLQLSFIVAIPKQYLASGWQHLTFPGASGPLVGLSLLLGLGITSILLMIDASFSPVGTTLVYTAATSRILYGMAMQDHLPKFFLKENKYRIPVITLYVNLAVGMLAFLPFPSWQKMVSFLSSTSILSYCIGPICFLALRKICPTTPRPFKLSAGLFFAYVAFYVCNLMLYWCSFEILWKLYLAVIVGLAITLFYQRRTSFIINRSLSWFFFYLSSLLVISYLGTFGGRGLIKFPLDLIIILPFSAVMLYLSKKSLNPVDQKYFHKEDAPVSIPKGL